MGGLTSDWNRDYIMSECRHLEGFMVRSLTLTMGFATLSMPALAQNDFSGEWAPIYHESSVERLPGPELGDYTELPLNDEARLRADSWDADRISVVQEY